MKRLLAALLALALAGQANARALVVDVSPFSANTSTGRSRLSEVGLSMLNSLGGDYRVVNINDFRSGTTAAISPNLVSQQIRDGKFWPNGCGNGSAETYGLIVILGAHVDSYRGTITTTGRETSVGGYATLHNAAGSFTYLRPGMLVSGTGITSPARVVSVDSLAGTIRVAGTVAGGANITLTWETPLRPDSLTLVGNSTNGNAYPRVPVLYIGNFMDGGNMTTTSGRCSTGVGALQTYGGNEHQDSTLNVYEVGNPYRSWKARPGHVVNATRDLRGWRPIIGRVSTRQQNPGLYNGNYDFPVTPLAFSTNPDTVALWVINNRDQAGAKIGGDAAPMIFCSTTHLFGTNSIDPGLMLSAFALADSLSGGALFGSSQTIPKTLSVHIDDGWKRGDSRFNVAGAYGGIGVDDTTAFKASIDSLHALQIPFVVGVEADSLGSVLLATGVTGNGLYYDQRWWARATLAHYTPHCHAGLANGTNRSQNILSSTVASKYLRPLDLWGIARARLAFGTVDSLLAYGLTDYVNEAAADSGATYWLNKRAFALLDSTFGSAKVDGVVMPPADDWTNAGIKHTRYRQHGLGVDSVIAAAAMSGATGIRVNAGINVVGSDDSLTTNNYGYYTTWRDTKIGLAAGGPGMPTWTPARVYGRPCPLVPTRGYPATASEESWSRNRTSHGGETVLMGLLCEKTATGSDAGSSRGSYVLALHCGDLGSSGAQNEATRPMFYTIKYVVNQIRTANAHALKDLVQIVYPEEVRP